MKCTSKTLLVAATLLAGLSHPVAAQNDYLTVYSITVGEILDSPNNRMTLPDGGRVSVNRIRIGNAATNALDPNFGAYNTNIFGGFLDGVDNSNSSNTGNQNSQGLTLPEYEGNRRAKFFSRIVSDPAYVDRGASTNYRNAIGYYIHTSTPQVYNQFLMLDCDGIGATNNQEWISSFGYNNNGTNYVLRTPSYILSGNTYLQQFSNEQVHEFWQDIVREKTNDNTIAVNNRNIIRKTAGGSDIDPDDINAQVLIDYGNSRTTDVFFLWGIMGNTPPGPATGQNSGLSPLVFKYNFDFGDAPASFNTLLSDDGARHLYTNAGGIYLGTNVNREADGTPHSVAGNDVDDNGRAGNDSAYAGRVYMAAGITSRSVDTFIYSVNYTNNTGLTGNIGAWIDWNGNGKFSASEGLIGTTSGTSGVYTFRWLNKTLSRSSTAIDKAFIRIRYSTDNITLDDFVGVKSDGEVEDYPVPFSIPSALPVSLIAFDVTKSDKNIVCKWKVGRQENIDEYVILKSKDGQRFDPIHTLKANSEATFSYEYTSTPGKADAAYYKLAIHSRSGEITYSNTRFLDFGGSTLISVYPNPAKDKLNVHLNGVESKIAFIYNTNGQIVRQANLNAGNNILDISTLKNGTYFVDLNINDGKAQEAGYAKFEVINSN